jgi:ABC-type multidrug transport system ATPase subunit
LGEDAEYKRMVASESILENGLEMIFSDNRVVEETEWMVSDQDREKILQSMELFKDVSFVSKLCDFGRFEFKRTVSGWVSLSARMIIPMILLVMLVLQFGSTTTASVQTSFTRLPMEEALFRRLILPGVVVQTNVSSLVAQQSERFVLDRMSQDQVLAAQLSLNDTAYIYRGSSAFMGPLLLTVRTLFGSGLNATLEIHQVQHRAGVEGILAAIIILFSFMCFELATWMVEEIAESKEKLKFLLLSARVPLSAYWIVMFVKLLFCYVPFVIITAVLSPSTFVLPTGFYILYSLQLFMLSLLLGSYFNKGTARGIMQGLSFGYLTAFLVLMLIAGLLHWKDQGLFFGDLLNYTGTGLPYGILYLVNRNQKPPSSGYMMTILSVHCILYLALFLAVEMKHVWVTKQTSPSKAFVAFKDVTKGFQSIRRCFPVKKIAVDHLNMEIFKNELFALLGPNGCGKTTTLSMLTAQQSPDVGSIHVDSVHVASNRLQVIQDLGYCPQFDDLLIDSMSVSAHLKLFCSINGMDSKTADDYVLLLLNAFGIQRFADYPCGTLSGGTKRKVSVAIATMLPRPLVVLDEASTGLDPLARQKLWSTVRILNQDRTTIMTTHYINETSVCDRIAIMNKGTLKCCDTEHELTKRVKGYNITLFFSRMESSPEEWFHKYIMFDDPSYQIQCQQLPESALIQLEQFSLPLLKIIDRLASAKQNQQLQDYSLGRASMETIFLDIVREERTSNV